MLYIVFVSSNLPAFTDKAGMRKTIIDSHLLSKPRGIVVHPIEGYLFWTDWSQTKPSISRTNLDGSDYKHLFGKPTVVWPNGKAF